MNVAYSHRCHLYDNFRPGVQRLAASAGACCEWIISTVAMRS